MTYTFDVLLNLTFSPVLNELDSTAIQTLVPSAPISAVVSSKRNGRII